MHVAVHTVAFGGLSHESSEDGPNDHKISLHEPYVMFVEELQTSHGRKPPVIDDHRKSPRNRNQPLAEASPFCSSSESDACERVSQKRKRTLRSNIQRKIKQLCASSTQSRNRTIVSPQKDCSPAKLTVQCIEDDSQAWNDCYSKGIHLPQHRLFDTSWKHGSPQHFRPGRSYRCVARNRAKTRCCHPAVAIGPFCDHHTRTILGVEVQQSRYASLGKGLIAARMFDKGECIAHYGGEILTRSQYEQRYTAVGRRAEYTAQLTEHVFLDMVQTNSGVARFINDARGLQSAQQNARMTYTAHRRGIQIRATQRIEVGQEIFMSYGSRFWNKCLPSRPRKGDVNVSVRATTTCESVDGINSLTSISKLHSPYH